MNMPPQSRNERKFRSIGDAVMEHAAANPMGTDDGIRFLELDGAITGGSINGAANLYLSALSIIRELQAKVTPASETQGQEAEQARRFRLIQSAYANEYRLRDSIKAEMKEAGARGELMMNGQCRDWNAYVQAIARREEIVEEVVNAANR